MLVVNIVKRIFGKKNRDIFRSTQAMLFLGGALLINVVSWLYLVIKVQPQENPIFLHYNIYYGVDLIGDWYQIFLMPLAGTVAFLANLLFARILFAREKVLAYVLIGITMVLELIILVASYLLLTQTI